MIFKKKENDKLKSVEDQAINNKDLDSLKVQKNIIKAFTLNNYKEFNKDIKKDIDLYKDNDKEIKTNLEMNILKDSDNFNENKVKRNSQINNNEKKINSAGTKIEKNFKDKFISSFNKNDNSNMTDSTKNNNDVNYINTNKNNSNKKKLNEKENKNNILGNFISSFDIINIQSTYIINEKKAEIEIEKIKKEKYINDINTNNCYNNNNNSKTNLNISANNNINTITENKKNIRKEKSNKSSNILNSIKINFVSGESNLNFPIIPDEIVRGKSCKFRKNNIFSYTNSTKFNANNQIYPHNKQNLIKNTNYFKKNKRIYANSERNFIRENELENQEKLNINTYYRNKNKKNSIKYNNINFPIDDVALNFLPSYYKNFFEDYDKSDGNLIYRYNNKSNK
jgi:hypothetical protein